MQFFYNRRFSHTILYIQKLSHTPRILSLGGLWFANKMMTVEGLVDNEWLGSNGPIRVEDETRYLTLRNGRWREAQSILDPRPFTFLTALKREDWGREWVTSTSEKPKRQKLSHIFRSSRIFWPPKKRGVKLARFPYNPMHLLCIQFFVKGEGHSKKRILLCHHQ